MPEEEFSSQPLPVRRSVFFSGNVQGVGFRFTACQVARNYEVTGYVKNLLDGRVEIVAEGTPTVIDSFVAAVEKAMAGYIEYGSSTDSTATGEFTAFTTEY